MALPVVSGWPPWALVALDLAASPVLFRRRHTPYRWLLLPLAALTCYLTVLTVFSLAPLVVAGLFL